MISYFFTRIANSDLEKITNYIADLNPSAADAFLTKLDETCDLLAEHPGIGRPRPRLGENVRSFPIGNYLLFYVPTIDGMIVLRLIYGGRDLPAAFQQE